MVVARRMLWLVMACLAVAAAYTVWQRRRAEQPLAAPVWPPFPIDGGHIVPAVVPHVAPATAPAWVPPVDGACPDGYPVKAKQSSRIYHVPGGRFYERTAPDRCYADPAAAEADGYRAAKS